MATQTIEQVADEDEDIPNTDEVVAMMMTENTGKHMLDSGSAYGRNWEEHQGKTPDDFWDEDECEVEIHADTEGVHVTLNVFHYLAKMLEYDDQSHALTKKMYQFKQENEELYGLHLMEEFTKGRSGNTYNRETILSQVLQTCMFRIVGPFEEWKEQTTVDTGGRFGPNEEEVEITPVKLDGMWYGLTGEGDIHDMDFIAVQVHGGCDVRGGYTEPVIFRIRDIDYLIMKQSDVNAYCERCGATWYSDDAGYHWYGGRKDTKDGEEAFDFIETDDDGYGSDKVEHKACDGGRVRFSATADY